MGYWFVRAILGSHSTLGRGCRNGVSSARGRQCLYADPGSVGCLLAGICGQVRIVPGWHYSTRCRLTAEPMGL